MRTIYVLFDLDGTLLDTLDDLWAAVNAALRHGGCPQISRAQVRRFLGNGAVQLMRRSVPGGESHPGFQDMLAFFKQYYAAHCEEKTAPFPGMDEALDRLRAMGCRTAIISNKFDAAVKKLADSCFPGRTDLAVGENEAAGIRRKPAPDMVLSAMKQLGADPGDSIYIGDSEVDAETAAAAGLPCILVSWGFRDRPELERLHPLFMADRPDQLPDLIREFAAASAPEKGGYAYD